MIDERPDTPEPESDAPESAPADEKRPIKEGLREGAAKAWGVAVEMGSLLGGESGTIVDAEREIAEANAEELLDRLDGEG